MLTKRIIPCLDVKDGQVVKGIHFLGLKEVRDPVSLAKKYYEDGADELVFLDISATIEKRKTMVDVVRCVAKEIFIPFTVGGGISTIEDVRAMLMAGADKVSLNSAAIRNPSLIEEATTVNVKERFVSLTKTYDVYVDGKEIGSVSGEYVNITGDIFTLTDANGNEIAKEKQIKRWGVRLNRLANLMDQDGNTTGYIGEEYFTDFFSLSKYNFHIYDSNKNELGYTQEEIMSLYYEFNVYNDLTGEILFNISKQPDMVDSYKIVKKQDSDISMKDIIFLTCIIDAIEDSIDDEE